MVKLFLPIQLCCLEISGMMIFAPYIFIGLLSSTSGQKVAISLSNDYANKSETVTVTCKVVDDVINDIVRITKDGTIALTCPSPPAPCITTVAAYSAVQDKTAGTTTMTISATDISRDTGNWKCQYGRTFSKAASLTVGTPVSITKMNELNTTAVIETSCTFPCAGVHVSCSVGGTDINCLCNIISSAKCGDLKERFLTITIYLDLFNGSASGLLTVHINNGFTAVSKTGNHNYTFTATTKTGVTIDDCAHKSILELAFGLGVCSSIICVICIMIWVKRVNILDRDETQEPKQVSSQVTIKASVRGYFFKNVQWTGPLGNILKSSKKYKINYERKTGKSTLQIPFLKMDDSGIYSCHAIGLDGSSAQDSVKITVYDSSNQQWLNILNKDETQEPMLELSKVTITASIHKLFMSSVLWTGPNGKILTSNEKYEINYSEDTSTLQISLLLMDDSGIYSCHARSFNGYSANVSVKITVYDSSKLPCYSSKLPWYSSKLPWLDILDKDEIQVPKQVSSEVTITASVYELFLSNVQWTGPHGKILTSNEKYEINYSEYHGKNTLQNSSLAISDSGIYSCHAIGLDGSSAQDSVKITVYDSSNQQWLNILNKDEFQEPILESSKVTIAASVHERFISSVRWIGPHENILTPNEKYKINYSKDNGKETLQISSLEISDSGIYSCHARALDGSSVQDSVEITVYGATDLDTYATDPNTCARKLILRLVFGIICITCIACFVILVLIGGQCALKLGLGFGLVLGICYVGCIIFIVIFVKKVLKPPPAPENRRGKYGRRSDVSRRDAEIQLEDIGLMSNKESKRLDTSAHCRP